MLLPVFEEGYGPPQLVEAGDFADVTLGVGNDCADWVGWGSWVC